MNDILIEAIFSDSACESEIDQPMMETLTAQVLLIPPILRQSLW